MYLALILLTGESGVGFEQLLAAATEVATQFDGRLAAIDRSRRRVSLAWGEWNCHLTFSDAPHVRIESREIAELFGRI